MGRFINIKGEKQMKKAIAVFLSLAMALSLAACGSASGSTAAASGSASGSAKSEAGTGTGKKITLTCFMSLGQWADHIDELSAAYTAEHPNVTLEWELPSSSTANDLLKGKLAADEMPDVLGVNYGESTKQWAPHLLPLNGIVDSLKTGGIPDSAIEAGYYEGNFYHVPLITEGYGILYNMNYLKKAGWDTTPKTFDELVKLCKDLQAVGIQPFVNHYKEDKLTLTYHYGMVPGMIKSDPFTYVDDLKAGKDMDIVNDPDWNAMVDFYDLTMKYGNADALTTDKQTARNDFFTEKAAMVTDEGSWELSNIRNINPAMENYVVQSYVPLTNDASRNKISLDLISISVSKTSAHPEEATELVKWLSTSKAATDWYMDKMGSLPVCTKADSSAQRGGCLSSQVSAMMAKGEGATSLQAYVPETVRTGIGEIWSLYLAGEIDRNTLLTRFAKLWTDYAAANG